MWFSAVVWAVSASADPLGTVLGDVAGERPGNPLPVFVGAHPYHPCVAASSVTRHNTTSARMYRCCSGRNIGCLRQCNCTSCPDTGECRRGGHCEFLLQNGSYCVNESTAIHWMNTHSCNFTNFYRAGNATATSFPQCSPITDCEHWQYAAAPATHTSNRLCANLTRCERDKPYQVVAPTMSTNRMCGAVGNMCVLGVSYQSAAATATTSCMCLPVSRCGDRGLYSVVAPTLTSNTVCNMTVTNCTLGQVQVRPPTLTSNRVCAAAVPDNSNGKGKGLSTLTIAGIVIGCVFALVLSLIVICMVTRRPRAYDNFVSEYHDTTTEMDMIVEPETEEEAEVRKMLEAWAIPEDEMSLGDELSDTTYATVWTGLFREEIVSVKIVKHDNHEKLTVEDVKELRFECERLVQIRHPHLISFYGAGRTASGFVFVVTEFAMLGSIRLILHSSDKDVPWPVRVKIAAGAARGMEFLHSINITHMNLKSDNVLLMQDYTAKISDFDDNSTALSGRRETRGRSRTGSRGSGASSLVVMSSGSGLWIAPEVYLDDAMPTHASNVYSFSIIMWELATRRIPWYELEAKDPLDQYAKLDAALREGKRPSLNDLETQDGTFINLMKACWQDNPEERPAFTFIAAGLRGGQTPIHSPVRELSSIYE